MNQIIIALLSVLFITTAWADNSATKCALTKIDVSGGVTEVELTQTASAIGRNVISATQGDIVATALLNPSGKVTTVSVKDKTSDASVGISPSTDQGFTGTIFYNGSNQGVIYEVECE